MHGNRTRRSPNRWALVMAGAAIVATGSSGSFARVAIAASTSQASHPPSAQAATQSVDAATQFRETFGLRSDAEYVALAGNDEVSFPNRDWGVSLSQAEAEDLGLRLEVQEGLAPAIEFAAEQPSYAGMYVDQLRGGLPVFLFTDVSAVRAEDLADKVEVATEIALAPARWTLDELTLMKEAVGEARGALSAAGVDVISASVHVQANAVEVTVGKLNVEAQAAIAHLAPAAIVLGGDVPIADACSITSCLPPTGTIGGLEIIQTGSDICTAGYVGHRLDIPNSNPIVLVTAGHCIRNGPLAWHHGGTTVGTAFTTHGWTAGSWGDVGAILLDSNSKPTNHNRNLYNPDTNKVITWTGSGVSAAQQEGYQVCRIGWGSWATNHNTSNPLHNHYVGLQCGTIVLYDSDSDGTTNANSQSCVGTTCKWISNMKVVSFDSTGGDSGGTVFPPTTGTSNTLWGTHVHSQADSSTSNRGWYSPYTWGREQFQQHMGYEIEMCLDSPCT